MNNCNFVGRLTKDPELKRTAGGISYVDFDLAVDRRDKDKNTDFIPCTAWRSTADALCTYMSKGSLIEVIGRLESRSYEKDGEKRTRYVINVTSLGFLGGSKAAEQKKQETAPTPPPVSEETYIAQENMDLADYEDTLPFSLDGY